MTFSDQPLRQRALNLWRQFEQTDRVGDRHALFADSLGDVVVRESKIIGEMF